MKTPMKAFLKSISIFVIFFTLARVAAAQYVETDLTGYTQGQNTRYIDPNLNGWGMAHLPNGIYAVADTCPGVITFYESSGRPLPLLITVPPAPSQPFGPVGTPAGLVFNSSRDFVISANGRSAPALLIIDTLDGTISGWNPYVDATNAIIMVDNSTEVIPVLHWYATTDATFCTPPTTDTLRIPATTGSTCSRGISRASVPSRIQMFPLNTRATLHSE